MTIIRAALTMTLAATLPAMPLQAQQTGKIYTIGILSSAAGPSPTFSPILVNALRDSGYQLARNLVLEPRYAAGKVEQLPDLAADLVSTP